MIFPSNSCPSMCFATYLTDYKLYDKFFIIIYIKYKLDEQHV